VTTEIREVKAGEDSGKLSGHHSVKEVKKRNVSGVDVPTAVKRVSQILSNGSNSSSDVSPTLRRPVVLEHGKEYVEEKVVRIKGIEITP
jgi:hypothetical protein